MKKLITVFLFCVSTTIMFAQETVDYAVIKLYRNDVGISAALNIQIGNQLPIPINTGDLLTYKLFSTGKILITLSHPGTQPELLYLDVKIGGRYYLYLNPSPYAAQWLKVMEREKLEKKLGSIRSELKFEEDMENPINNSSNKTSEKTAPSSGTGFLISTSGIIVTNAHVIENYKKITVKGIGGDFTTMYSVKVILEDKSNDIAVLQIENKNIHFDSIPYNIRSSGIETGEEVFLLGYPLTTSMGEEIKLTTGVVSAKTGYQGSFSSYQVSALAQPGNSGSPLFDKNGNLIGIINAKIKEAEGVTYAIKINYLNADLEISQLKNEILNPVKSSSISLVDLVKQYSSFIYIIEVER